MGEAMAVGLLGSGGLAVLALTFWFCFVYAKASARMYPTYFVGVVLLQTIVGAFIVGSVASRADDRQGRLGGESCSGGDVEDAQPGAEAGGAHQERHEVP